MFLKTEAFFNDMTPGNTALLIRAETAIPAEFVRRYKANAVKVTPIKSGWLRRSIITRQLAGTAEISWRAAYAGAVNAGQHTVREKRVVNIDGRYVTLQPRVYPHKTGSKGFAHRAYQATQAEMPAALRELGLVK